MRKLILYILILCFVLGGCGEDRYSPWAWEMGRMYMNDPVGVQDVCRHRVGRLGLKMFEEGVPFDLVIGFPQPGYGTIGHTWIEYQWKGKTEILDGTQSGDNRHKYTYRRERFRINQGDPKADLLGNMRMKRWVNNLQKG